MSRPWFHGASRRFEHWAPPPLPPSQPAWRPHSFVCLSRDAAYARLHRQAAGGLCRAHLRPGTPLLDLRQDSRDAAWLWQQLRQTPLGAGHQGLLSYAQWLAACRDGSVLRYLFASEQLEPQLFALQRLAATDSADALARQQARLRVQDFTRGWIEQVIGPAAQLGYAAVICNEHEPSLGRKPSTQLFVFDVSCLSPPRWSEQAER